MDMESNVLPKKGRVKKNHSYEEKLAIIDSFKHSGLSGRAFCHRENISVSTLYKWVRLTSQAQIIPETNHKKSKNFIPVKVVPGNVYDGVVEIKLSNGIEIKFSEKTSIALIGNLIRELQHEN